MERNESWFVTVQRRVGRSIKDPPFDLILVAAFGLAMTATVIFDVSTGWGLRPAIMILGILLLPGHVIIAAIYPENGQKERTRFHPSGAERAALTFGTSVALAPLIAIIPGLLGLAYKPMTLLGVLACLLAVGIPVATYRRKAVPEPDRFQLPIEAWLRGLTRWLRSGRWYQSLTRALLVASVLMTVFSFGYVLTVPQDGEQYSTITLLSENDSGDLVAAEYPRTIETGESAALTLEVTNEMGQQTSYTVVVRLERVENVDEGERVVEVEQLTTLNKTVDNGETWRRQHTVTPAISGENLRLRYYLFTGSPPDSITTETAHDFLHIWIDVPRV